MRTTYVNKASPSFRSAPFQPRDPSVVFPLPSFSSSHGSPAMQPPLRRLHSGSPLRYDLAGASLCATRASTSLRRGENAFSTPMKAKTQQDEDTGARRLLHAGLRSPYQNQTYISFCESGFIRATSIGTATRTVA